MAPVPPIPPVNPTPPDEIVYSPRELVQDTVRLARGWGYRFKEIRPYSKGMVEIVFESNVRQNK